MSGNRVNRFTSAFLAKKNRIVPPTKVLHFFGISKCDDSEIEELFVGAEAPRPNKVKWVDTKKENLENSDKGSVTEPKRTSVDKVNYVIEAPQTI